MKRLVLPILAIVCSCAIISIGHPGGLDASGGHRDRKNGGYHYHRGASAGEGVSVSTPKSESSTYKSSITTEKPATARPVVSEAPLLAPKSVPEKQGKLDVYFSPGGGCTEVIVKEIAAAKSKIRIQAYSFTSEPIAKAIIEAKKRGVEVVAILDKSNRTDKYSAATFLRNQGAKVFIDATHAIAHNKVILLDDQVVVTGSFNFSKAAEESNAENVLIIREYPAVFGKYASNFGAHLQHSEAYEPVNSEKLGG